MQTIYPKITKPSGKISVEQLKQLIEVDEVDTISLIFIDMYGRIVGEKLDPEYFLERMNKGFTQVNALNVVDFGGAIIQGGEVNIEGGYSNSALFPILNSMRISYMPKEVIVFSTYKQIFKEGEQLTDPRDILIKQVERAAKMGFQLKCAGEYEFVVIRPLNKQMQHPCSENIIKNSLWQESAYENMNLSDDFEPLMKKIRLRLKQVGIQVEGQQIELCPNQHELKIKYCEIIEQADRMVLYKQTIKQVCKENGYTASFMAKPVDNVSNGCHIHLSVYDIKTKQNSFAGTDFALNKEGLSCSKTLLHFIGGLVKYTRESFLFYAPFVNSYKRYIAEDFAPRNISSWAYDNRTASIRVVGGGLEGEDLRLEFRYPGADCNPYLAIASVISSGLQGIMEQIQPPEITSGNVFAKNEVEECYLVPLTLKQSIDVFKNSKYIEQYLGKKTQDHLALMHYQEFLLYQKIVTDWEVKRYFEKA